jgi:DNA replication and repair protein RecF
VNLRSIRISNLRCIEKVELELPPGLTLLFGDNGSGKTSLLEAIFLLGRGRSFRTRSTERLIRRGTDHLRVIGQVDGSFNEPISLGFEAQSTGTVARVAGQTVRSLAELSQAFAVQVIEPGVHKLLEEGGHRRRRWMDWAVFHVEPQFVDTWSRYTRILRQRNAALRSDPAQTVPWDGELARAGEEIAAARGRFIEALEPYWRQTVEALTSLDVELHYSRGWSAERTLAEALALAKPRDTLRQVTHVGPHRADVSVRLNGRAAREMLSRGQQKLVAVAMTLVQMKLLQARLGLTPTLLLDDPAAELDPQRLRGFIDQVDQLRTQLIVTSLGPESRLFGTPERTFHVDQGRVQPL